MDGEQFPRGHPTKVYRRNFPPIEDLFGLVYCRVRPPDHLYHPALAQFISSKVMFALCDACAREGKNRWCDHTDEQRCMDGVFVSEELKMAVNHGYQVVYIYEAWHWAPEFRSTDLFKKFIMDGLVIKVESSGYPEWANSDELRHNYVVDFELKHPGAKLNPDRIVKNSAKRSVGKMIITQVWGFIGKQENCPTYEFIDDYKRLETLVKDPNIDVTDLAIIGQKMEKVLVVYSRKLGEERCDPTGCLPLRFVLKFTLFVFNLLD